MGWSRRQTTPQSGEMSQSGATKEVRRSLPLLRPSLSRSSLSVPRRGGWFLGPRERLPSNSSCFCLRVSLLSSLVVFLLVEVVQRGASRRASAYARVYRGGGANADSVWARAGREQAEEGREERETDGVVERKQREYTRRKEAERRLPGEKATRETSAASVQRERRTEVY